MAVCEMLRKIFDIFMPVPLAKRGRFGSIRLSDRQAREPEEGYELFHRVTRSAKLELDRFPPRGGQADNTQASPRRRGKPRLRRKWKNRPA